MSRVLLADSLHPAGRRIFEEAGVELHDLTEGERGRLPELIPDFDGLVVRSRTKVTAELLRAGRRLRVVGRAGIGVDNVDVAAATDLGVLVVNAPTANLIAACEHTFALLLALCRRVPEATASLKAGEWERNRFEGVELEGKTLGIAGFGRIGQSVAQRARAFEMRVFAYDPYLDAAVARRLDVELLPLEELLPRVDVLTLHTPLTDQTRNLLDGPRLRTMKRGSLLVNCARGGIVDEVALLAVLEEGHLGGAALDVFAEEPPGDLALVRHPRVVCTPHIGAQTAEAQERVATDTAAMVVAALAGSLAVTAVNLPFRAAGPAGEAYLSLAEQLGRLASALSGGSLQSLTVDLWGIDEGLRAPLTVAAVKGALTPFLGEAVNYVNAERLAQGRGIEVARVTHQGPSDYAHLIGVRVEGSGGAVELAGTLFGEHDRRVVRFQGFPLEFRPEGRLLVLQNRDVPGVVGKLGTLLGGAGVNIAEIHLAREVQAEEAMAVLRLDQEPSAATLQAVADLPEIRKVQLVDLRHRGA